MKPGFLERITIRFPGTQPEFTDRVGSLLAGLGRMTSRRLDLTASDERFYPRLEIDFQSELSDVAADFHLAGGEIVSIKIENTTGVEKRNPLPYRPLTAGAVADRLATAGWRIVNADHIGFNLPWFGPGIHPRILELRGKLATGCLYHRYPTGEPWDFILPGDEDEIAGRKPVDYLKIRQPKFELVSFGGASTPLIQIDVGVDRRFEKLTQLFPEALVDRALEKTWIYLDSPFPVDVCLVIGGYSEGDWGDYFSGHRL